MSKTFLQLSDTDSFLSLIGYVKSSRIHISNRLKNWFMHPSPVGFTGPPKQTIKRLQLIQSEHSNNNILLRLHLPNSLHWLIFIIYSIKHLIVWLPNLSDSAHLVAILYVKYIADSQRGFLLLCTNI